jgi:hypothetical protein
LKYCISAGQVTGHNESIPKPKEQKLAEEAKKKKEELKQSVTQEMDERQVCGFFQYFCRF